MKTAFRILITTLLVLTGGCGPRTAPNPGADTPMQSQPQLSPGKPTSPDFPAAEFLEATAQANTGFALALYRELGKAQGNVFFSPYSISSALAMAAEGARGTTAEEMGRTLQFPEAWRRSGSDASDQPWHTGRFLEGLSALNQALAPKDPAALAAIQPEIQQLRKAHETASANARKFQQERNWDAHFEAAQEDEKIVAKLNAALAQLDQYELRVANGLWGEQTYPFREDFLRALGRYAPGAIHTADFLHQFPAERKKINDWVARQTNDRITDIIPELPPDAARLMRLILVNAIYFKGQWAEPFLESETKPRDFWLGQGRKIQLPTMHAVRLGQGRYGAFHDDGSFFETPRMMDRGQTTGLYPEDTGFAMLELPYKGNRLGMVVLAPMSPDGLGRLESRLTPTNLTTWLGRLTQRTVQVYLPKFRLETDYRLHEALPALGMKRAVVDPTSAQGADFSGLSASGDPSHRLFISQVLHKAFVEVTEKGTEAAAATAIMMPAAAAAPVQVPFTPVFKADRPFLFLIRDRETGAMLFVGRITQPS